MEKIITVYDTDFVVDFDGSPSVEDEEAEINSISLGGWDLTEVLHPKVIEDIQEQLDVYLQFDYAAELRAEAAERRWKEQRDKELYV